MKCPQSQKIEKKKSEPDSEFLEFSPHASLTTPDSSLWNTYKYINPEGKRISGGETGASRLGSLYSFRLAYMHKSKRPRWTQRRERRKNHFLIFKRLLCWIWRLFVYEEKFLSFSFFFYYLKLYMYSVKSKKAIYSILNTKFCPSITLVRWWESYHTKEFTCFPLNYLKPLIEIC